ncbi:translation initiation factor IF-2-like isoform X2 [Trachemys scripta elegans]|uniref:translation initiation factor IF-2-like isoform X2 n=1 Tax=Trachemys scripta elegans TaxID=31138 RepID=UPI0015566757|nr:translation initiation factor IF-2-like isoform X2 [Trachemys scripta elegans]
MRRMAEDVAAPHWLPSSACDSTSSGWCEWGVGEATSRLQPAAQPRDYGRSGRQGTPEQRLLLCQSESSVQLGSREPWSPAQSRPAPPRSRAGKAGPSPRRRSRPPRRRSTHPRSLSPARRTPAAPRYLPSPLLPVSLEEPALARNQAGPAQALLPGHVPGKPHMGLDALSRTPSPERAQELLEGPGLKMAGPG